MEMKIAKHDSITILAHRAKQTLVISSFPRFGSVSSALFHVRRVPVGEAVGSQRFLRQRRTKILRGMLQQERSRKMHWMRRGKRRKIVTNSFYRLDKLEQRSMFFLSHVCPL